MKTRFTSLSFLPVPRDDQDLLWVCWSEGDPATGASTVALVRRRGSSVRLIWSRRYAGAYEPVITQLYGSLPSGSTGLLLHYQLGADDANATLLAVSPRDVVSVVGSVGGQMVDLLPWKDNTIRVSTGPSDPTICYGWAATGGRLTEHPC